MQSQLVSKYICEDGCVLSGPPETEIDIPDSVKRYAGNRPIEVVWLNDLGGLTFRLAGDAKDVFIKWVPANSGLDLQAEQLKLD